jgi:hypothetical protein
MQGSALPSNNERISNKGGNGHIMKAASCVARDELASSARRDTGLLLASPSIAERHKPIYERRSNNRAAGQTHHIRE